jgi:hypothetical protein
VTTIPATFIVAHDRGTWDVDETGAHLTLSLEQHLLPPSFDVSVTDDGRVFLDGQQVEVRDGRGICADVDLETRFTALLPGSVYSFSHTAGGLGIPIVTTVAFCDGSHFSRRVNFSLPSTGEWSVEATNGVATLHLTDAASGLTVDSTLTQAVDGTVLVDGEPPVADPSLVLRAACS